MKALVGGAYVRIGMKVLLCPVTKRPLLKKIEYFLRRKARGT